jgi:glutathione S-transferase
MITLYTFGPGFGLPDPSPFVVKAEMLLKLSGLPYEVDTSGFRKAPKGKLPYIRDGQTIVADSTFIRLHLERQHGADFDKGLTAEQRGIAWAAEKMCEEHLYWLTVHDRWMNDENFARGPAKFFDAAPALLRPLIKAMIRRQLRRTLHGQGIGRYSDAERAILAERAIAALAGILGDKPYLMGAAPCGADATVFAFTASALCPLFPVAMRKCAEGHANLVAYRDRMMQQYYPEFTAAASQL